MITGDAVMLAVAAILAVASWRWGTPLALLVATGLIIGTVGAARPGPELGPAGLQQRARRCRARGHPGMGDDHVRLGHQCMCAGRAPRAGHPPPQAAPGHLSDSRA